MNALTCGMAAGLAAIVSVAAQAESRVTTGALQNFPGYGFEIRSEWQSNAPGVKYQVHVSDRLTLDPQSGLMLGEVSMLAALWPMSSTSSEPRVLQSLETTITFFNLTTGQAGLPPELSMRVPDNEFWRSVAIANGSTAGFGFHTSPAPELRFSQPRLQVVNDITDGAGHAYGSGGTVTFCSNSSAPCIEPSTSYRFVSSVDAFGGQYLTPSTDPNCGDLGCMNRHRDIPQLGSIHQTLVVASTVPEPAVWAQILAGVAVLGGVQWRRRGMRTGAASAGRQALTT